MVILKADRIVAGALEQAVVRIAPDAEVLIAASAHAAWADLATHLPDVLITGLDPSQEGDVLGLLGAYCGNARGPTVMVVVGDEETRLLVTLTTLRVHAAFDALHDEPARIHQALELVVAGGRYWSPTLWQRIWMFRSGGAAPHKSLTPQEQMMLSVLGDGCDDVTASELVSLKPATVSSIRRNLHRKLGVQHRGELIRFAAQHGYVRFTSNGVVRPGFSLLAAASRPAKPATACASELTVA